MSTFLSAYWKNVTLFTYAVSPEILTPHLPPGVELDMINGKAFVSLVAFEFLNTKVKGIKIPFHVNFPEVNLRFYVKKDGKRGVVFIRELVPKIMIAKVAKWIYNEPYEAIPMRVENKITDNTQYITHSFTYAKRDFNIWVESGANMLPIPPENSLEHFFKEHDMGYGISHRGKTLSYEVEHPYWQIFELKKASHNVDFGVVYGEKWSFLNYEMPYHVMIAAGSAIKVFSHKT